MARKQDLTAKRFGRLEVLYDTDRRDKKGSIYWHCRCDCGNELDVTEDCLVHGSYKSCGCLRQENMDAIHEKLTFVGDTCVEWVAKRKSRSDNTSGFRGVYRKSCGTWKSIIRFQKKYYYLGTYKSFDEAVAARLEAEEILHDGFIKAYSRWNEQAKRDPKWGKEHPFFFHVERNNGQFLVSFSENMDAEYIE